MGDAHRRTSAFSRKHKALLTKGAALTAGAFALGIANVGFVHVASASACSWSSSAYVWAQDPRDGGTIWDTGGVDFSESGQAYCGSVDSNVAAQRKVCGGFGCNYETKAYAHSQPTVQYWQETPGQTCISGTNRYRTLTNYNFVTFPLATGTIMQEGTGIEFTCK